MNARIRRIAPVLVIGVLLLVAGAWYLWGRGESNANGALSASGTVEAVEVIVAPELSGRASEVLGQKGESVTAGQPLLKLDGTLLQAQRKQAAAARDTSQAGLDTARSGLDTSRTQYQQILETARLAEAATRTLGWTLPQPWEFDQPAWYWSKQELITAAQSEVDAAQRALDDERQSLQNMLTDSKYKDAAAAEEKLASARAAFLTAQDALDRVKAALDNPDFLDAAQAQFDGAKEDLENAQTEYNDLLDSDAAQELIRARGRVRAVEERYGSALDRLAKLHTGEDSYAVKTAAAAVKTAEFSVTQAEKGAAQAQAQVDLLDAQIGKLTVYAPADGVILERNIEPGELALAGSSALVIGRLDRLTITVYLPEDRYGEIRLEQTVTISVDSFPGETFTGTVSRIADRAQFTPRNVQTEEGRRTTVFAAEIRVADTGGRLKPGMPADVAFAE